MDVSSDKAAEYIVDRFSFFSDEEDDDDMQEVEVADIELPSEFRCLTGREESMAAQPYLKYARRRGLTDELIRKYNIGYCLTGRYAKRLIVPVYHFGKVVNFVARTIGILEPKVLTPPGNEQSQFCFNLDNIWGAKEVLVVEGVFDALVLPDKAVATFGKKISKAQVALLKTAGVETVTFCYDEDAIVEAYDFANTYLFQLNSRLIELPPGEDPSSLGREQMLKLVKTAKVIRPGTLRV